MSARNVTDLAAVALVLNAGPGARAKWPSSMSCTIAGSPSTTTRDEE